MSTNKYEKLFGFQFVTIQGSVILNVRFLALWHEGVIIIWHIYFWGHWWISENIILFKTGDTLWSKNGPEMVPQNIQISYVSNMTELYLGDIEEQIIYTCPLETFPEIHCKVAK